MIDFGLGVHLDTFEGGDLYRQWRNSARIWRWTRQNDLLAEHNHNAWFEKVKSDRSIRMYSIVFEDEHVGACGFTSLNFENRNAEFSLYIEPGKQGFGISKPALLTLFYHGFRNLGLKSIWGETFHDNIARQVFKKIGMKEDGIRRQFYFRDGKFHDAVLISILDTEFLKLHGERTCFG